jgi:5'-3' exonuclease
MGINFQDKIAPPLEGVCLLVDALNLAFRWKHQGRSDFREEYRRTVESLAKSYKAAKIIIAADHGSSTYRKNLLETYKQNRKDKFAEQTEEEKRAFEEFFREFEATLEDLASTYPVFRFKGVEADDIAAHIVKNRSNYGLDTIWLISSDRDWDLLITDGVNRFSYVTRKEVTRDNWSEHYPISQDLYISYKCLVGDKGDNIPGIPGIGDKRATDLILQYGSAMDIYDMLPVPSKYKYLQSLNDNAEVLLTNYQLMDLLTYCDEAIGEDNLSQVRKRLSNET